MLFIFLDFFLKCVFSVYYNHFLFVFWKLKPCIIIWIMQGFPFPIITYQVITGNYSAFCICRKSCHIITYQVITGNYSQADRIPAECIIITYQVITGNYSQLHLPVRKQEIITYQVITGNYSQFLTIYLKIKL